jgi:hypothetical protein
MLHAEVARLIAASQVRRIVLSLIRAGRRRLRAPLLFGGAGDDRLTPPDLLTRAIARRYGADYREYRRAAITSCANRPDRSNVGPDCLARGEDGFAGSCRAGGGHARESTGLTRRVEEPMIPSR